MSVTRYRVEKAQDEANTVKRIYLRSCGWKDNRYGWKKIDGTLKVRVALESAIEHQFKEEDNNEK